MFMSKDHLNYRYNDKTEKGDITSLREVNGKKSEYFQFEISGYVVAKDLLSPLSVLENEQKLLLLVKHPSGTDHKENHRIHLGTKSHRDY